MPCQSHPTHKAAEGSPWEEEGKRERKRREGHADGFIEFSIDDSLPLKRLQPLPARRKISVGAREG